MRRNLQTSNLKPQRKSKTQFLTIMKHKLIRALAASAAIMAQVLVMSGADAEIGFQKIFNGKDLAGWEGHPKL